MSMHGLPRIEQMAGLQVDIVDQIGDIAFRQHGRRGNWCLLTRSAWSPVFDLDCPVALLDRKLGDDLRLAFIENLKVLLPEVANSAPVAADLLCMFLADRELQIKDALAHGNMQAARRLVNGGTNGLDRFTDAYNIGHPLLS